MPDVLQRLVLGELREQALAVPGTIVDRLGMDVDELQALHARLTEVIAAAKAAATR